VGFQKADIGNTNKRSEERYPFLKTVKCVCVPEGKDHFKAVTIDISSSGLSLYLFTGSIREGLQVKIQDELPAPSQTGTVRWVQQVDQDLYKAGLQFH
jgi:hypothetical protein